MNLYLIRHGETTGDVEHRYGGDYDDHLTEKGKKQAKELAQKLKGKGIQAIYSSPRLRAVETADIVGKELHLSVNVVDDLRERNNYGILTGLVISEARKKYPQEVKELAKGIYHQVNGSERYELFKKRVTKAFERITTTNKNTAIITHGGVISCIVREILNLGEMKTGDCAIIETSEITNRNPSASARGKMAISESAQEHAPRLLKINRF